MIHEEIATFEVCKLAKEKGFPQHIGDDAYIVENEYNDEYEVGCYYPIQFIPDYLPTITAPTQSLLQRWLREEKGIHIILDCELNYEYDIFIYVWRIDYRDSDNRNKVHSKYSKNAHYTYELALKEAIGYALVNLV